MKTFLLLSFFFFHLTWAQFETTTSTERLYYRGAINDAAFQLELNFDGDTLTGQGYDEQGREFSVTGRRDTQTNTVTFSDNGYSSYLAAFAYDSEAKTYLLSGVRISENGANEPFTLRLIATYSSVAFRAGSLESTLLYPLWLGNYEPFNQLGEEDFQDGMVNLAYTYFKGQLHLSATDESYGNEPVSRNATAQIRFASPEFVSLLVQDGSYESTPIESINLIAENGQTSRLELSDVVTDTSGLAALVTEKFNAANADNIYGEAGTINEAALSVFTLSPTGLTVYLAEADTKWASYGSERLVEFSLEEIQNLLQPNLTGLF